MVVLKFITNIIKPFRLIITFSIFVSIIWAIELSLRPYLIKSIIDSINQTNEVTASTLDFIFLYFLLALTIFIIDIIDVYSWIKFTAPLKQNIGIELFSLLAGKKYIFFTEYFAGSLGTKLNNCINAIPKILKIINQDFFRYFLAVIISSYTLWQVDYRFSISLLIWVSLYLASSILLSPLIRKRSLEASKESSQGMGYIIDVISNILSVKLFSNSALEQENVKNNFQVWTNKVQDRDYILVHLYAFQTFSFIIFQALCLYWLSREIEIGNNKIAGDFILVFTVSFSIYHALTGIARTIADFTEQLAIITEGLSIITHEDNNSVHYLSASPLKVNQGKIVFNKVKFQYKGNNPLFSNLSVTIKPGEKVGLVGYSGSGKTSFVNLILKTYELTDGSIIIDDQKINNYLQEEICKFISMIPQDPFLFHRTIRENIRYGRLEATNLEVIEAANKADAHDFIHKLPLNYDSLIGERGVKLSGGQRQRIAIARAILKNAPILILDEATSHLDSLTEHRIQESLWALMKNKTTLVIAHRLSTLLHMDRILVFDKGKIIEDGNHFELIKKSGFYKKLWDAQIGGYLPEKSANS